jgi:hypothetical protein
MDMTRLSEVLESKGYTVSVHATAADAAAYINGRIDSKSVGFGGSVTLEQMGLYELLSTHNECIWHQRMPENATSAEVRLAACSAEIYISSVNALAVSGEIVNIDGVCNRVSAIFYGHEKVYLVVGSNKIAADLQGAIDRARNVASPKNAQRLGKKTPCAVKADRCYDCNSPDRICRGLAVLWTAPTQSNIEVVLVDEALGY